jgi:hypothetical protein
MDCASTVGVETKNALHKPIIIIGTGRCGSTAMHCLFARHPQVAWMSGFLNDEASGLKMNRRLMRGIDLPLVGGYLKNRFKPWECYPFWERHCRGFSEPCRDLTAADVLPRSKAAVRKVMEKLVTPKRNRLLIKITGWPRLGFLRTIFPDAKFIHVLRDGRAVANSNIAVDFWDGWRGPQSWRFGLLTPQEQETWEKHGQSFVALAGIEWNRLIAAVRATQGAVPPEDFLEVRYENFCGDPLATMRQVLDFCELPMTDGFAREIRQYPVESRNEKWRSDLTRQQQAVLEEVTRDQLQMCGYI